MPPVRHPLKFSRRVVPRLLLAISIIALSILGIAVAQSKYNETLTPEKVQRTYRFKIEKSLPMFTFKVRLKRVSSVNKDEGLVTVFDGVDVYRDGDPEGKVFETLPMCEKDLPMELYEGDENLKLISTDDYRFHGDQEVKLLQYENDHLDKHIYCIYQWDVRSGRFKFDPALSALADPVPHPKQKTITSSEDYQGGDSFYTTYKWVSGKLKIQK